MAKCLDLVRANIEDFTNAEMDEVLNELKARQKGFMREGMSADQAAKAASEGFANDLKIAAKIERRNAAINRRIRLEAMENLKANWSDDPTEGILSILYGSPKSRVGSRDSVAAAQSANFRRYQAGIESELDALGLMDVLRRGEMDSEVSTALWFINDEERLARISSSAVSIARILDKYREMARIEANRAGGWIGKLENYVVRQTHQPDRLLRAGFDSWKSSITPKLDLERMFPEGVPEDFDGWLRETYANLTTGVRPRSSVDARAERMAAFKGPGNLAKRVSQDRTFHFLSPEDWIKYNEDFGAGNLREAYINDIHRRAESTGLMQVLGTNPEYNLDSIVKAMRIQMSRTDPALLRKFENQTRGGKRIENAYREVSGYTRTVASSALANFGAFVRMWNTLTSMGMSVLSAVSDVPIRASLLRYQGQSFFGALGKGLVSPFEKLVGAAPTGDRKAIVHSIGHFNDVLWRNVMGRFSPDDNIPGRIHKVTNTYFKWNMLGYWTQEGRRSSLEAMGRFHGEMASRPWAGLSDRTRRSLERFRIDESNWDVVRKGTATDEEGNVFLTPDAIRQLHVSNFTDQATDRVRGIKEGLLERVQKRMKADERAHTWIEGRRTKFQENLDKANERLIAFGTKKEERLVSRTELLSGRLERKLVAAEDTAGKSEQAAREKFVEAFLDTNQKMAELNEQLTEATDWWKLNFDFEKAPDYGKRLIRQMGVEEGTLRERAAQAKKGLNKARSEFKAKLEEVNESVESLRSSLPKEAAEDIATAEKDTKTDIQERYEEFNTDWRERYDELKQFTKEMNEQIEARAVETEGDLDKLGSQVERALDDTRNTLANRLQRMYADDVDSAIISPDARALALVRQGTQSGSPMGEALRLFWQFKTFGIGIIQRGLMREFYGYDKGRGGRFGMSEARGIGLLLASTLAFGYVSMVLKDLARGKTPRPLDNPRTYVDAMSQGGSLGIYGDYLLGTQARFGKSFLASLGGPTVGKLDQATELYGAVLDGKDARAQALKFAISEVPYNNLFYTRAAADYLFLYELQEAMNPGYLRRYEKKVEEETGSEWWLRPTEAKR